MAQVIWTGSALQDLTDIGEYISKDSEKYAEITVSQLFSSTDILEDHPKAGKVVPEFEIESIRELIRGNYRIVYQLIEGHTIYVLAVHHGARLLGNIIHPITDE